jgi:IS5 family transposase
MKQISLFAEENRFEKLSKLGDCLERLKIIDWESFRPTIALALIRERKSNAGRPPYDCVLLFKIIVLQRLYNLSDDQTEYQINDRMSFMRFLGLGLDDKVPDAKTIWLFKDMLTKAGIMEQLFSQFNRMLEERGIVTHKGTIVDATFVDAPRQRNSRDENKQIKNGEIPNEWKGNPHKMAQKDVDARWTKKGDETHYGYKDHVKVDADSKLILDYAVTPANVHDSNEFEEFFNEEDEAGYADSAYVGKKLPKHVRNEVCEKGYRNKSLTEEQKENNHRKARIRCRIEHVFGFMTMSMHGITVRSIGQKRAAFHIGLTNLVYNFCRYAALSRKETVRG